MAFIKNENLSFGNDLNKNILFIGDNKYCLEYLLNEYSNKIDVIYIDPPYGTAGSKGKPSTNYNHLTREKLLNFLEERLLLAKNLLSDTGSIWVTMDYRNIAYTRILMDRIFGENNFLMDLIRIQSNRIMCATNNLNICHDYTLAYGKTSNVFIKGYGDIENHKKYKNPDNDPKGSWIKISPRKLRGNVKGFYYTVTNPYTGQIHKPENGFGWHFTEKSFYEHIKTGRIVFLKEPVKEGKLSFYIKSYLNYVKNKEKCLSSIDTIDMKYTCNHGVKELLALGFERVFSYPKPVSFVKKILQHTTKKDSIVLDFFAGSGTTGQSVLDINRDDNGERKFILCQLNEKTYNCPNSIAHDITVKRLKRVMTGECYDGYVPTKWLEKNIPYGGSLDVLEYVE